MWDREYTRIWKRKNADRINATRRAQRIKAADPDWRKAENAKQQLRRVADPVRTAEQNRKSKQAHRSKRNAETRQWKQENRSRVYALNAARRARQETGIARFFRDEIVRFYMNCPSGYHVDHIHPLRGRNFSGLHVPWNLQYLTREENMRKFNKLDIA